MKILKLQAENVKRLSAVEVEPKGKSLVIVAGKNGQGKSSVLDSITFALSGTDSFPSKPVRKGEDKATVKVDLENHPELGDISVTRTITSNGNTSLTIRNKDHEKQESPQTILDKLFSNLTFDPLEFRLMKPDKRAETLRALLGLDFTKEDAAINQNFNDRTVVNREVKSLEATLKGIAEYPNAPAEEVSISELTDKLQAANDLIANNNKARALVSQLKTSLVQLDEAISNASADCVRAAEAVERAKNAFDSANSKLEEFKKRRDEAAAKVKDANDRTAGLKDPELSTIKAQIFESQTTNRQVQQNKAKAEKRKELAEKVKEAEELTKAIEKLESAKRKRTAEAKFPVVGLGLSDTREVEFNGVPFDQCSTADQLKISISMGLAMNPKLKVLLVRQGNDLDTDNLALVAKMAEEAGAQIWLERVSTEGDVSVVIEDGHVKEPVSISSPSNEEEKMNKPLVGKMPAEEKNLL